MPQPFRTSSRLLLVGCLAFLGLVVSTAAWAQTTGFIGTRPDCMPGVQDELNYTQGPDAILDSAGDVNILLNTGQCCDGHWEGFFNLKYPHAGPLGTPRFYPIWASNDFGTRPQRNEAEAAFPSVLRFNGKWRFVYVSTFLPFHTENRDRLARIDLDDLISRATPGQVTNQWILPTNRVCQPLQSCEGPGTGINGAAVLQPNGTFFIYHPEGPRGACSSGWIRHQIEADMSLNNPAGNGCLTFEGQAEAPALVSDIALGTDGNLYMIAAKPFEIRFMEEWISTDPGIGLHWTRTGREWVAPAHPLMQKGWTYFIWDGGYLKDENRLIVEPRVVVSGISEGTSFENLGNLQLHYWADAGASLPPHFGEDAHSCNTYGGHLDIADCNILFGWAWDQSYPNTPISVDVYDGTTKIANIPANLFRGDLVPAGIGNGVHGFNFPTPASLKDGQSHQVHLKYIDSDFTVAGSPVTLTCGGDQPPSASFTASCTNLSCTFNGSASTDDVDIVSYQWTFGDGATGTGVLPSHTYTSGDTYTVTLTVTDTIGQPDTDSQPITVGSDQPPNASFTASCTDLSCSFDASASTDDVDIVSYQWTFGDGSTASGVNVSHTYASGDTYTVTLTVTDTIGQPDTDSQPVTVSAATGCTPGTNFLCLNGGRFKVSLSWFNPDNGTSGTGKATPHPTANTTGFFWFFSPENLEVGVKLLDGGTFNGNFWVYHGAITDLHYTLTVTDTVANTVKTYQKTTRDLCGGADIEAFPLPLWTGGPAASDLELTNVAGAAGSCVASSTRVCLLSNRFRVEVKRSGTPQPALKLNDSMGVVTFFSPDNPEVFVKVLDGRAINNMFWVFYGSMTDQAYQVVITDTVANTSKTYTPPAGLCGAGDTSAFPG